MWVTGRSDWVARVELPGKMTRQRLWQLRKRAQGRCQSCGKPRNHYALYCDKCALGRREYMRKKRGSKPYDKDHVGRPPLT